MIDDPKDKTFTPFGDARYKIENGTITKGREMYFAIYQAISKDARRPGLFKEFAPDFFDLIIVDECHRGSARDESNWREILEYFASAYQIGMTATPLREDNRDTYRYFGNPIYTYSLRQGIDDGFLAPYRVQRVITDVDAAGWRPSKGEVDRYGREIPDEEYQTKDFERVIALRARTEAFARHLTDFMKRTDRFAKTIVFCVDQEHADEMRRALNNLNTDLVQQHPNYVARVTSEEGKVGKGHLSRFQELETTTPVILTTSQLLTTGVDAPTCKNVVLVRVVNSMTEFKQIIGRGTRLREDYGKLWFNIIDYTGSATHNFADPDFDGYPEIEEEVTIDQRGYEQHENGLTCEVNQAEKQGEYEADSTTTDPCKDGENDPRKYYVDSGSIEITSHLVYELDANGKQLRVIQYTDYTAEKVCTLFASSDELRDRWADPVQREEVLAELEERGIDFAYLAETTNHPDADPLDLICHLAFDAPLRTRRERAEYRPMAEVAPIVRRQVEIDMDGEYPELGARSFGKGIFHKPTLIGAELDWQKLYRVQEDDLVISNIKAWEGAIAVANSRDRDRVGSHRYITCVPKEGLATAGFLCFYLLTEAGLEKVQAASPGSADRNRTLAMKRLEKIEVPVPNYDRQLWFNGLQAKVSAIQQTQADNQTELDALLPAILDKAFRGEL